MLTDYDAFDLNYFDKHPRAKPGGIFKTNMKKLNILTAILFLPLLASAYQMDKQYTDMARQLNETVLQETAKTEITPKELLSQVKNLIKESRIKKSESISKDEEKAHSNKYYKSYYCYDTEKLTSSLQENQLQSKLQDNMEVLNQVAEYIVGNKPHRNDFETLLTVGVTPIEAVLRVKETKEQLNNTIKEVAAYFDELIRQEGITADEAELKAAKHQFINDFLLQTPITYIHYTYSTHNYQGVNHQGEEITYTYIECLENKQVIKISTSLEEIDDTANKLLKGKSGLFNDILQGFIAGAQTAK